MANTQDLTIRIASVPCGASDAFMHPACCGNNLSGVEYHDLTITELLQQQIVYCDGCGERIVPQGVALESKWSGRPDPDDPDNYWIDDATGERVNAETGERTQPLHADDEMWTCPKCGAEMLGWQREDHDATTHG